MVLEKAVYNSDGNILLPAGSEISEKHIDIFMAWGVSNVEIYVDPDQEDEEEKLFFEEVEKAHQALLPLFQNCNTTHPAVIAMMRLCAERNAEIAIAQQRDE